MARKRYNEENILLLLREIEVHLHGSNLGGKVTQSIQRCSLKELRT